MNFNKHDLNAFSAEELREIYKQKYIEVMECTKEWAETAYLMDYSKEHDFCTYANVEAAIKIRMVEVGI
jgi:hypothetical protein